MKRISRQMTTKCKISPVMTHCKSQSKWKDVDGNRSRAPYCKNYSSYEIKNLKVLQHRSYSSKWPTKRAPGQVFMFPKKKQSSSFTCSSNASIMKEDKLSKLTDSKLNYLTNPMNILRKLAPLKLPAQPDLHKRDNGVEIKRKKGQSFKNKSNDKASSASDNPSHSLELTSAVSQTPDDIEQERLRRVSSRRMSHRVSQYSVISTDFSPSPQMIKTSILENLPRKSIAWAAEGREDTEMPGVAAIAGTFREDSVSSSAQSTFDAEQNDTETPEVLPSTSHKESGRWFLSKSKVSSTTDSNESSDSVSDIKLPKPLFSKSEAPEKSRMTVLERMTKETLESESRLPYGRRKKSRIHKRSYGRKAQHRLRQKSSKKRKRTSRFPKDDSSSPISRYSHIMPDRSRSIAARQTFAPRHSIFVTLMEGEEPCPYDEPQLSITSSRQDLRSIDSMGALIEAMFSTSQFREMYGDGIDQMTARMHCMFNADEVMEYYRNINMFNFSLQQSDFSHMYVEDVKRFNEKIRRFLRRSNITINDPKHLQKITRTLEKERKRKFIRKKNLLKKQMHFPGHELKFDETSPFSKYYDYLSKLKPMKSKEYKRKQMYSFVHNPMIHTYSMECLSQNSSKTVRRGRRLGQAASEIRELTQEKIQKSKLFTEKKTHIELHVSDIPSFQRGKTIECLEPSELEKMLQNLFTPKYGLLTKELSHSTNSSSSEVPGMSMDSPNDSFSRIE